MKNEPGTKNRTAVLVDGCRLPFRRSGTDYSDVIAYDLARSALKGLLTRTGFEPGQVDQVIMGTVIQDVETSNIAREAALAAGIPDRVPAHTVTMACISSNQAIANAVDLIEMGRARAVIAGGTETLSDVPLRFNKSMRKRLIETQKYKSPLEYRKLIQGLKGSDLLPKAPAIAEYTTGESMGQSADRLAAMFGVSREAQDAYALRSHQLAAKATEEGLLEHELIPTVMPPSFTPLTQDNTFRADTSLEKLATLQPVFVKPYGTVTAGNSSPLTDGASATLIMSEAHALELGYTPKAYLRDYVFVAQDPGEELLLGPAYAVPKLLDRNELTLADMDVIEIHEAFAGQVLAVFAALESDAFARDKLNRTRRVGQVEMDRVNTRGGSLSLGHPFGATGARLVTTAANRLQHEGGRYALVTACAAGGLGHAMLIERYGGDA
jgi:acetyl-CoA acetyltransferase family protein